MEVRRVVTGVVGDKCVVLDDARQTEPMRLDVPGWENFILWGTNPDGAVPLTGMPGGYPAMIPAPGGSLFTVWQLPPDEVGGNPFGMHQTDSVDYVVVLSGRVSLVLDGGDEVELSVGDTVVQGGGQHAWHNRTSDPCVMAVIVVGATRA